MTIPKPQPPESLYDQYYSFDVEGWRIGLVTCLRCGCALILGGDGKTDAQAIHEVWHDSTSKA